MALLNFESTFRNFSAGPISIHDVIYNLRLMLEVAKVKRIAAEINNAAATYREV